MCDVVSLQVGRSHTLVYFSPLCTHCGVILAHFLWFLRFKHKKLCEVTSKAVYMFVKPACCLISAMNSPLFGWGWTHRNWHLATATVFKRAEERQSGAMFGLLCGYGWFEGRWSSSRWGYVCDTARKCKWDQLELLVTFSLCHWLLIIKAICVQKLKQRRFLISSWLELRDLTWNHDNGKVWFLFGVPFWSFWVEGERTELSMLVPGLAYAFHVVILISALFPLEIWMGHIYVKCKAVVEWECKQYALGCLPLS